MDPRSGLLPHVFQGLALIESCLLGVMLFSFFFFNGYYFPSPFRKPSQEKRMHLIPVPFPGLSLPLAQPEPYRKLTN